ncbi:MAG: lipopolysaccharide biosynthesis protein [Gammaproteobacteria bacterium HGW-Gammaproteobacteria-4]|jgi:UDP-N-acetylmuramyl pentapeptide phosphotransferase/UDP-N-acetylglucosamine-1-phosphate transferase|nr:MAG: lipopolysaccharide biosynthesis protein [Gammaproteobacteria bacterium HGW-Gammaproteobacteria-4]
MSPGALPLFPLIVLALLASVAVTAAVRRIALKRNMLDLPGQRRSHAEPTPRGGGVGVLAGALLPPLAVQWLYGAPDAPMLAYVIGTALVAAIGWLDDVRGVPAIHRLLVHAAAAAVFVAALHVSGAHDASPQVLFVAWFAILSLINIWNFMDGINGIASSQAALVALALAALLGDGVWMLAAVFLAVACVGFLPFNLPKARVFLGDVGSGAIGFMVAALLVQAMASGSLRWPLALVLVSAFAIDSALTLGKRVIQGKAWWRPHREHTYQWLVRAGYPHWQVTLAYLAWTALAVALVLALPYGDGLLPAVVWLLATALTWVSLRAHARGKMQRTMR